MDLTNALERIIKISSADGIIYNGKAERFSSKDREALDTIIKEIGSILGEPDPKPESQKLFHVFLKWENNAEYEEDHYEKETLCKSFPTREAAEEYIKNADFSKFNNCDDDKCRRISFVEEIPEDFTTRYIDGYYMRAVQEHHKEVLEYTFNHFKKNLKHEDCIRSAIMLKEENYKGKWLYNFREIEFYGLYIIESTKSVFG